MSKESTPKLFEYAACSTCRKAKKWLDAHGIGYTSIPIVESPPKLAELTRLVERSGLPIDKWFNTSGGSYRDLIARIGKPKFAAMSQAEKVRLLAADGKMIKRPVLVDEARVLVGFDEAKYRALDSR
jgi:Spx/MgsR family transcriptional regulator